MLAVRQVAEDAGDQTGRPVIDHGENCALRERLISQRNQLRTWRRLLIVTPLAVILSAFTLLVSISQL